MFHVPVTDFLHSKVEKFNFQEGGFDHLEYHVAISPSTSDLKKQVEIRLYMWTTKCVAWIIVSTISLQHWNKLSEEFTKLAPGKENCIFENNASSESWSNIFFCFVLARRC